MMRPGLPCAYRDDMHTWDRVRRAARRHPHVLDAGVAAGLCAFTLLTTALGPQGLRGQLNAGAVAAAAAGFGALVARRRWPLAVLVVTITAGELFFMLSGGPANPRRCTGRPAGRAALRRARRTA